VLASGREGEGKARIAGKRDRVLRGGGGEALLKKSWQVILSGLSRIKKGWVAGEEPCRGPSKKIAPVLSKGCCGGRCLFPGFKEKKETMPRQGAKSNRGAVRALKLIP